MGLVSIEKKVIILKSIKIARTEEEIKVLFNPFRLKILDTFLLYKKPITVKQLATLLGKQPSFVHYHVMMLLKIDVIELVRTEVINGIVAKFYQRKYKQIYFGTAEAPKALFQQENSIIERKFVEAAMQTQKDIKHYFKELPDDQSSLKDLPLFYFDDLYLDKNDHDELYTELGKLMEKYSERSAEKQAYSTLLNIVKTDNK